jgi:hypothetical protein
VTEEYQGDYWEWQRDRLLLERDWQMFLSVMNIDPETMKSKEEYA